MNPSQPRRVAFLPGAMTPAAIQYAPLLKALDREVEPLLKDLELFEGDAPPPGYTLNMEVEGLLRAVDAAGWDKFHLFGYSGGGSAALAFIATHPERVKTLALIEPPAIPTAEWIHSEADYWEHMQWVMSLPPDRQMPEFFKVNLKPGVPPPQPSGDPPPWMAKRPAGLKVLVDAFVHSPYHNDQLRRFDKPVYLAITSLSDFIEEHKAEVLEGIFPDFRCEVYEGIHHFNPPQRAEPERVAKALRKLWQEADQEQFSGPGGLINPF